jgi:hypothetical protein
MHGLLTLSLLAAIATADELGSFVSSEWYETIQDDDGDTIWFQLHYPAVSDDYGADADPSGGPYPLAVLIHGYMGSAWMYDTAADAFASMGFVVVNMDTETHAWMDPWALAEYSHTAGRWVEGHSEDPEHWLAGMVDQGAWTLMAHSLGNVSMASLAELEPRVSTVLGYAPYRDEHYTDDFYTDFGGSALFLGGNEDTTSPPPVVQSWFADLDAPARGLWLQVHGTGHQAITDIEFHPEELSDAQQLGAMIELSGAFLMSEVWGAEDRLDTQLCYQTWELDERWSHSIQPGTSVSVLADDRLRLGLASRSGHEAVIYGGPGPGRTATEHGEIELRAAEELDRVALDSGAACTELTLPEELAGLAWLQVAYASNEDVVLGRRIDVFETGAEPLDTGDTGLAPGDSDPPPSDTGDSPPPGDSEQHEDTGSRSQPDDGGCAGCASATFSPAALLLALGVLGWRREERG